jgi:hypothetical protein
MKVELFATAAGLGVVVGLLVVRWLLRRLRRLRRLERAQAAVAEAMADGRLTAATGEVLLQHLDGLRRACVRVRED